MGVRCRDNFQHELACVSLRSLWRFSRSGFSPAASRERRASGTSRGSRAGRATGRHQRGHRPQHGDAMRSLASVRWGLPVELRARTLNPPAVPEAVAGAYPRSTPGEAGRPAFVRYAGPQDDWHLIPVPPLNPDFVGTRSAQEEAQRTEPRGDFPDAGPNGCRVRQSSCRQKLLCHGSRHPNRRHREIGQPGLHHAVRARAGDQPVSPGPLPSRDRSGGAARDARAGDDTDGRG